MYTYEAYGLGIHSALPLPELQERDVAVDVTVQVASVDRSRLQLIDAYHAFWATSDTACYFFKDAGAILVQRGREIVIDPMPEADERVVRVALLGPALALILHQRGKIVLHGSAIDVAGHAVAFLGGQGWGKSTTAAALHANGYGMVTDDVLAIAMCSGIPLAIPSFPQFKLWPGAVEALGGRPETLPLLHPALDKRAHRVTQGIAQAMVPLTHLYLLNKGPSMAIEPLSPQEALRQLLHSWYGARFGLHLLRAGDVASHFRQFASLAGKVRVCRLSRPPCLSGLSELARFVEDDLASSAQLSSLS